MKRVVELLGWLTAVALFAFAGHAVLAQERAAVLLVPGVSQETREGGRTQAGRGSRERRAAGRDDLSPAAIVRSARTVYVRETRHLEKKYLEYKLQKYRELQEWGLMLVEDADAADLIISIDKTALNYIFTITDPRTSVIVTSGKAIAVNGRLAAEYLGKEIIKKIRDVRAGPVRRSRDARDSDYDEEEESES